MRFRAAGSAAARCEAGQASPLYQLVLSCCSSASSSCSFPSTGLPGVSARCFERAGAMRVTGGQLLRRMCRRQLDIGVAVILAPGSSSAWIVLLVIDAVDHPRPPAFRSTAIGVRCGQPGCTVGMVSDRLQKGVGVVLSPSFELLTAARCSETLKALVRAQHSGRGPRRACPAARGRARAAPLRCRHAAARCRHTGLPPLLQFLLYPLDLDPPRRPAGGNRGEVRSTHNMRFRGGQRDTLGAALHERRLGAAQREPVHARGRNLRQHAARTPRAGGGGL